jgi:glutathione S-transferase
VVRIRPKQQVPVLLHGDLEIFDSPQIFEYLEDLVPEPALWCRDSLLCCSGTDAVGERLACRQ